MAIDGVDFSRGGFPGSAALKAAGNKFCVRYVVSDLSPEGRGITWDEYQEYLAGGIDVAVVWEGAESRMREGLAAGQEDARDAQTHIVAAGLPATMPCYFACDYDATPEDQAQIDAYLVGAAAVMGVGRVGIYGGFWVVSRCAANRTATWFWQTSAWSGGQWFAGNHLEQYAYNQYINGVNVDAVRALQENYGQASKPTPKPGKVVYPAGLDADLATRWFGSFKASNGVTVSYSEGDELSALWLASGSYAPIVDVGVYVDSPSVTRLYWRFGGGVVYWRANAKTPISLMGKAR